MLGIRKCACCAVAVLALGLAAVHAAEVRFIAVTKGLRWRQDGTGAPVQQPGNSFEFRAYVEPARSNAIVSATLRWPAPLNATRNLAQSGPLWQFSESFSTRTGLNSADPNGTYTFVTQTTLDGRRTNVVTLTADGYPNPPRVANFAEAQTIDSKGDFTLRWDPAGTGANGFVQIQIRSPAGIVFESPSYPQAAGALNGSASSFVILRNKLAEGETYTGSICIWRKVTDDVAGYPGAVAWSAYTQTTEFPLRTAFAAVDAHWYGMAKVQRYLQTGAVPPAPDPAAPVEFAAFADPTRADSIVSAALLAANGAALGNLSSLSGSWRFSQPFANEAALNARFAAGAYLSLVTARNGTRTLPLDLPAPAWPPAPEFSNFLEANALDSSQPFVLRWGALAGVTAGDFVQVRLKKANGELRSPDHPFAPGALNGASTAFAIPAGFLAPGEVCEAGILVLKGTSVDPYSYPKVPGWCGYARETTAAIRARGGNVTAPEIRNLRRLPGAIEFEVPADPGRQIRVQGSADFTVWTDLLVTNAPTALFKMRLSHDSRLPRQFLRAAAF